MTDFDIAISGAGMAGASLAVALARQGRRVCVIEPVSRQADHQPSYDDRTLVLNAASLNILGNLGLLDTAPVLMPIRNIHVSRRGTGGHLRLRARDHGRDAFGAVILARELGNILLEALQSEPGIRSFCPDALDGFESGPDSVTVYLESGQRLSASLLVGADGTGSRVRRLAGLDSRTHDYGQSALVFNVRAEEADGETAWERFTDSGPVALLPQPDQRLGVVMVDSTDCIEGLLGTDEDSLLALLTRRFGGRLGRFSDPGKRVRYALGRLQAEPAHDDRLVLIGNAATTVHPVSAQGFNLGLRDVAGLTELLESRDDPGASEIPEAYSRSRAADRAETLRYTHTLATAFTNPSMVFGLGTRLGLAAHALLPGLERRLASAAMGFRSPVSRLAARDWRPEGFR